MSVERRGTKALELWAKRATDGYQGVSVSNMTTAWRNGLAFCALIHSYRPDLIEFSTLKPENIYENNALAFRVGEQHLGIPALLDAEDMVENEVPDRLSVLTYVSQFYQAFAALGLTRKKGANKDSVKTSPECKPSPEPPKTPTKPTPPTLRPVAKLETKKEQVCSVRGGGGRRGEVCVGCHNPVFLAERLLVGSPGKLLHRTCFRCARCTTQLTLASYYETEKGQFCCETCPDEERPPPPTPPTLPRHPQQADSDDTDSDTDSEDEEDDVEEGDEYSQHADHSLEDHPTPPHTATPTPLKPRTVFLSQTLQQTQDPTDNTPRDPTSPPDPTTTTPPSHFQQVSPALFGVSGAAGVRPGKRKETDHCDDRTKVVARTEHPPQGPPTFLDTGQHPPTHRQEEKHAGKEEERPRASSIVAQRLRTFREMSGKAETKPLSTAGTNKWKHSTFTEQNKTINIGVNNNKSKEEIKLSNSEENSIKENSLKYNYAVDIDKQPEVAVDSTKEEKTLMNLGVTKLKAEETTQPTVPDIVTTEPTMQNQEEKMQETRDVEEEERTLKEDTADSHKEADRFTNAEEHKEKDSIDSSHESLQEEKDDKEYNPFEEEEDESQEKEEKQEEDGSPTMGEKEEEKESPTIELYLPRDQEKEELSLPSPAETSPRASPTQRTPDHSPRPARHPPGEKENSAVDSDTPVSTPVKNAEDVNTSSLSQPPIQYPDDLNPFGSDDDDDDDGGKAEEKNEEDKSVGKKKIAVNLNPFASDEEDEEQFERKMEQAREDQEAREEARKKQEEEERRKREERRLNPFWSEDEEEEEARGKTTASAKKVKPPRPPPPTLARNSSPSQMKGGSPASPRDTPRKRVIAPPPPGALRELYPPHSPSSSPAGSVALRKKGRRAPAPPQLGRTSPSGSLSDSLSLDQVSIASDGLTKTAADEFGRRPSVSKSEAGEWQRKKGPAPPRPVPQKRVIKKLPMRLVQQELQDIEVKQTELERQGVLLETTIRARSEAQPTPDGPPSGPNSIEVEDMILQLFELVNEKNELFRRQTELMYLKREKRLEEEYVELEFQIRCLMLKSPAERTKEDQAQEEELIGRLVKVVEQRDQIINCLELDRLREAQEDESIATHMMQYQEQHIDGIENGSVLEGTKKKKKAYKLLKKKKKKKKDKEKKEGSKGDADKDIDETEVKKKKKKKWPLF